MPLDIARRLGRALNVSSETAIRDIDRALSDYARLVPGAAATPVTGSIDASQVASGTLADARVAESNVTQHEAAVTILEAQISDLGTYLSAPVANASLATMSEARIKGRADGAGSGAPADLTPSQVKEIVRLADGAGSGLDADTLDGQQGAYYVNATNISTGLLAAARFITSGTFTPGVSTGSGSITLDTTHDVLSYFKIGPLVFITGTLAVDSVSSPGGDLTLTGLPYTALGERFERAHFNVHCNSLGLVADGTVGTFLADGAKTLRIRDQYNRLGSGATFANHIAAGTTIGLQGFYITDE